jgi:hypothetical protein
MSSNPQVESAWRQACKALTQIDLFRRDRPTKGLEGWSRQMEREAYWIVDRMAKEDSGFTPGQLDLVVMLIRAVGAALPPMRKAG